MSKICVFTVIKNEHLYLREWIEHNIKIGVDKIYVFEDEGSDSHKDILDDYEPVELITIEELFRGRMDKLAFYRSVHRLNQNLWQNECFDYIRHMGVYDWVLVLDIDEFIESERDLHETLDRYVDYDEVLLYWINYGANGHVDRPDYVGSYRSYYTKRCEYDENDKKYHTIRKKAVNMRHIKDTYHFISHHHPSSRCFCNSAGVADRLSICTDHIYLKHYITKSFEDYYYKLYKRGMCYKEHRSLDDFFKMNSDMAPLKDEILNKILNKRIHYNYGQN